MKNNKLIIGTRGSKLALWQANFILNEILPLFSGRIELRVIKTKGDKILDSPLAKIGDKGLFVKEIENKLLSGDIDLAVHSMKDMPTDVPEGLILAGASKREDPRDAFISLKYGSLKKVEEGGVIATSSLRRKAQILYSRPDIKIVDIRGNVDTRVRKLKEGAADGLVMAVAGLVRMGLNDSIRQIIDPEVILPAVGQGCIAIETRKDDKEVRDIISKITSKDDFKCIKAERALMKRLEGGCQVPIGALATIEDAELKLEAMVASLDGSELIREEKSGNIKSPEKLGIETAEELLKQGADKILEEIRGDNVESTRNSKI